MTTQAQSRSSHGISPPTAIGASNSRWSLISLSLLWSPVLQALLLSALGVSLPVLALTSTAVIAFGTAASLRQPELANRVFGSPVPWLLVAFLTYSVIQLPTSTDTTTGAQLITAVAIYGVLPGCAVAILNRRQIPLIPGPATLLPLLVGTVVAIAVFGDLDSGAGRLRLEGANPIWIARSVGITLVLALQDDRFTRKQKVAATLLAMIAMALSGSRGPIASVAAVHILMNNPDGQRKGIVRTLGRTTAVLAVGIVGYVALENLQIESRLLNFGSQASDGPDTRLVLAEGALNMWLENPVLGAGAGSFAALGFRQTWAHNFFLESLSEYGIVGSALLLGALILAFRRVLASGSRHLGAALLFMLLVSMTSGSFAGNYALFWMIVLCGTAAWGANVERT